MIALPHYYKYMFCSICSIFQCFFFNMQFLKNLNELNFM